MSYLLGGAEAFRLWPCGEPAANHTLYLSLAGRQVPADPAHGLLG